MRRTLNVIRLQLINRQTFVWVMSSSSVRVAGCRPTVRSSTAARTWMSR